METIYYKLFDDFMYKVQGNKITKISMYDDTIEISIYTNETTANRLISDTDLTKIKRTEFQLLYSKIKKQTDIEIL